MSTYRSPGWPAIFVAAFLAFSASASAQESEEGPAIKGLTVVFENIAPGFLTNATKNGVASNGLYANFYVTVPGLKQVLPRIKSLRIEDDAGFGWNIDINRYSSPEDDYLGGYGRWYYDSYALAPRSFMPLRFTVKLELADGKRLQEAFDAVPPSVPAPETAEDARRFGPPKPRFLVNAAYRETATPYHTLAIEPALVTSARLDGDSLRLRFSKNDPRALDGYLAFYDGEENYLGSSDRFAYGSPRWLNGGGGLLDGENTIDLDLRTLELSKGKGKADIAGFMIVLRDRRSPASNLRRQSYLFLARTGIYGLPSAAGGPPALLSAEAQKLVEGIAAFGPQPPRWMGGDGTELAWATALSGILSRMNGYAVGGLMPFEPNEANLGAALSGIRSSWGISDRASMIETLRTLFDQGHSSRWESYCSQLDASPEAGAEELARNAPDKRFTEAGYVFTSRFRDAVAGRSLRAWDLGRLVFLVRDGYALGFLDEDESIAWLRKAGAAVRERYRSWPDFAGQFLIGRMFWGGPEDETRLYLDASKAAVKLLGDDGAWTAIPWPPRSGAEADYVKDPRASGPADETGAAGSAE